MKIILICLIIVCSTYIGYGFGSYYRRRLKFFKDLSSFADKLVLEINFSKTILKEIIENNGYSYSSDFKKILNNFLQYLSQINVELNEESLLSKLNFLTNEERQTVYLFFKSLGRYDVFNQIKEIESYNSKFKSFVETCVNENKKYGSLYVKLGLMLGVLIGILLI